MNTDPIPSSRRLGVLISGRGSNLQAIHAAIQEGRLDASIAVVISNRAGAPGLAWARRAGLETRVMPHDDWPNRGSYDAALVDTLRAHGVDLVCLAGFMRLLSPVFVDAYANAILNVHPSLLPAFPGLDAQRQAWEHGAKVSGVTIHLVNASLDAGPIVLQQAVLVAPDDTPETLAARILLHEHRLYPKAIAIVLDRKWRLDGRRFICE
jgi:phosphoribosylglycinamide formyltransferase-1